MTCTSALPGAGMRSRCHGQRPVVNDPGADTFPPGSGNLMQVEKRLTASSPILLLAMRRLLVSDVLRLSSCHLLAGDMWTPSNLYDSCDRGPVASSRGSVGLVLCQQSSSRTVWYEYVQKQGQLLWCYADLGCSPSDRAGE